MTTSQKRVVKWLSPPTVASLKTVLNPYFMRDSKHTVSTCLVAAILMTVEPDTPLVSGHISGKIPFRGQSFQNFSSTI